MRSSRAQPHSRWRRPSCHPYNPPSRARSTRPAAAHPKPWDRRPGIRTSGRSSRTPSSRCCSDCSTNPSCPRTTSCASAARRPRSCRWASWGSRCSRCRNSSASFLRPNSAPTSRRPPCNRRGAQSLAGWRPPRSWTRTRSRPGIRCSSGGSRTPSCRSSKWSPTWGCPPCSRTRTVAAPRPGSHRSTGCNTSPSWPSTSW
mmetsp:Transcript_72186/g.209071  ORF Transcript_72186/g.209071 Transcript_72186/m.209071 type:complete len:201 (-) Transcript_72186:1016-1618(-)